MTTTQQDHLEALRVLLKDGITGDVLTKNTAVLGVVEWTAGGGGGGDSITVNGVAATNADFDSATPAAPANGRNVVFQKDASAPDNISAHILGDGVATNFLNGTGAFSAPAGGGDSITVNGVAVVDADFDSATPAAPANGKNVVFQKDAGSPANISAHILGSGVATQYLDGTGAYSVPAGAGMTHPQAMARTWF